MSARTPQELKQKEVLAAVRDMLQHWQVTAPGDPPPPALLPAVKILCTIDGADMLRLLASNKATLSSLLR